MRAILAVHAARRSRRCDVDGGSCCFVVINRGDKYVRAAIPPEPYGLYAATEWRTVNVCAGCDGGDVIAGPRPDPVLTGFAVESVLDRWART